jgi:ribosomal protein S27AE
MLMPIKDPEKRAASRRAYYLANRERLLIRMREINAKPEHVAKRIAYAKENPDVIRRLVKAWRKRNPEKREAWWTYANALRRGKIIPPDACSRCGKIGAVDGHHNDYSKPLDVIWLCRRCHIHEHKGAL